MQADIISGLMLAYRTEDASTGTLIGTQIAVGIGGGFLNVPVQLGVQASASHGQVAAVTTVWLTLLEVGGAVGAAVSGAIWSTYVPSKLQQYLPSDLAPTYATIYGDVEVASNYTMYPVGSPARIAINRAYQETMRYMLIGAICAAAPIVPLSFFLKNHKLDQMEQPVAGKVIGSSKTRETRRSWTVYKGIAGGSNECTGGISWSTGCSGATPLWRDNENMGNKSMAFGAKSCKGKATRVAL
jgi:SP family sugar:H+ symporter-like MFS transporter